MRTPGDRRAGASSRPKGEVLAVDGTVVTLTPHSLCLHGDTPGSVAVAAAVRAALEKAGVELEPFA